MLLDAEMPGMNGFEVCHALKADPALAGAAVVFVTSHGEPAFEVEALGVGAADFITKPPMAEQVLARVHARLRCPGTAAVRPKAGPGGAGRAPTRLLLVDGDDAAMHFERVALAPMVDAVQFARSGAEALAWVAREPVDLVVAALQLPDMDGFEMARRLRADPALCDASLLLLGPRADWRSEAVAFERGANDFMARPFLPAVLQARVRNLLRQRRDAAAVELARRSAWQRLGDARVADLVAAAPDAWLAGDADGQIVLANTAAGWRLGVEPAQLLGRPLAELQACAAWPGTAATWPLGEGRNGITALRLHAAGDAR
jgi:DNA-binding response OmpR family regulator